MSALGQRLYESGVMTRPVSKYLGSNTNSTAPRDNADTSGTNRYDAHERIWIEHTMKYYLVAYPNLSAQDRAWIESYRRRYDLLYRDVIEPHFTLVFGGVMLSEATVASEAERLLDGVKPIQFELALATINPIPHKVERNEFAPPRTPRAWCFVLGAKLQCEDSECAARAPEIPGASYFSWCPWWFKLFFFAARTETSDR